MTFTHVVKSSVSPAFLLRTRLDYSHANKHTKQTKLECVESLAFKSGKRWFYLLSLWMKCFKYK